MPDFSMRRALLFGLASVSLVPALPCWSAPARRASHAQARFAALERAAGGRLGVFALDTEDGTQLRYRADERFPVCSTFKVLLASAILERSARTRGLLERRIHYTRGDLVAYSPISEHHVDSGMSVAELCAAALQYSDNTAANLLIHLLGGPAEVVAFARSVGDRVFRLDRLETALNTAIPGDARDTSTPASMGRTLERLAVGDALGVDQRDQLRRWLRGNTTGATRIRAGVPASWRVGDKTGTGDYGTTNDVAVLWPPARPPLIVALYYTQPTQDAKPRSDVLAQAARIIVAS